jgi:two-component system sensor histidine kinase KdpD
VPGCAIVGLVTFICFGLRLNFPTVSFFYLIVVVLQSLMGDFLSSAIVSVLSFLCLDYFFIPPFFSLRVSDSSDILALISFLVASLVVTRLTSEAQNAADSEERQRRQMARLYELARQLLELKPSVTFDASFLKPFRSQFELSAVCVFEGETAKLHLEGESLNSLAEFTRSAYISERDFNENASEVAVRLLRVGGHTVGAIGFEGLRDFEVTANPLAALATIMMERCYAFEQTTRAAAATDAEMFRGAMLDALAHEFKTPLATIVMAAGGIQEAGPLRSEQLELAETVEEEASRLGQLTTRLLRLARFERGDVKPHMELTDIRSVVGSLVEQYSKRWPDRRLSFVAGSRVDALVERELFWIGVGQLLDNACKYSQPDSEIKVSIEEGNQALAIQVWNSGSSIPESEQRRIFERFYRGDDARVVVPGSGLGLYVARKIAIAHGGTLELQEQSKSEEGVGFRFVVAHPDNK